MNLTSMATAVKNGLLSAFDVVTGDSGQNAQVVTGSSKEVSFTTTTVQAVASTDVKNYNWVSVHIVTQGGSSTVAFQISNDNTNWVSTQLTSNANSQGIGTASTTNAATIYCGPIQGRYFRLNVTGIASGTTAGVIEFSAAPKTHFTMGNVAQINAGQASHAATIAGGPVRKGGRARTSNYAAVTNDQTADIVTTLVGAQIGKPYSIPEADWSYAAASGGIVNTSDNVLVAAAAAGIRNYLTGISIQNASATVATEVVVKDGSTIIWRGYLGITSGSNNVDIIFPSPLKSTAATALNVACITTSAAVYANAQGYQAP